jgi:GntR family transcriptional regulator/MocR family aminotransferase
MDMTPFLDNKSKTPLYRQLYDYFKQEISHARITKGMKLPSKRRKALSAARVHDTLPSVSARRYYDDQQKAEAVSIG